MKQSKSMAKDPGKEYHNERVLTFNDMHDLRKHLHTEGVALKTPLLQRQVRGRRRIQITIEEFIQLYGEEGNFRNKQFSINLFTKSGFKKMFKSDR